MAADNRLELVVNVDSSQANRALGSINDSMSIMEKQALQSARGMSSGMDRMAVDMTRSMRRSRDDIQQAKDAAELLGRQIGVQLPEAVRKFMGESRMLGSILSKVFTFSVYFAAASALVTWVQRIGEKMGWWGREAAEAKRHNDELTRAVKEQVQQLDDYYLRLEKIRQARSMIGLDQGSARASEEAWQMRAEMERARIEYADLAAQYNRLYAQSQEYRIRGGRRELTDAARDALRQFGQVQKDMIAAEQRYGEARETLKNKELEMEYLKTSEIKRLQEERLRNLRSYVDQTRALEISAIQDPARRIGEQRIRDLQTAGVPAPGVGAAQITERQAAVTLKAIRDLQNIWLNQTKQVKEISPLARGTAEYQRQMDEQLKGLDEWIRKNKDVLEVGRDNYEAMRRAGEDMLRSAQASFERTANAIEGFVHRTFISARRFSDVWRQALMQVADFAISQFARMAAAWWTGRTGGASGAGYFAGGTGMMTPVEAAAVAGNQPPAGGGAGWSQAAGSAAGWIPRGIGGLPSWGLPFVGGLFTAAGIVRNPAAKGGLYAATGLAGISALGAAGVSIGGLSFAALAASLSLPVIGGIIGAGIGIGALVGWLRKSAEEKARQKIRAVYGVDLRDKGVLRHIVEIAKSSFGGNLDMAIRSDPIAELVRLYAMSTGQGTGGLPRQMTPASFMQSGGTLYQMPPYTNGLPGGGPVRIPAALPAAPIVINVTVPGAKDFFERETVSVIARNPRLVQATTEKALKSNYGRRELASLQISPGTLTR